MKNYYELIKNEIINNEVYSKVKDYSKNRHDLQTRYNIGKLLIEAQGGEKRAKYGDNLIKEYSKKLINEVGKQYNERTLRKIRQFYLLLSRDKNWSLVATNLSWSHWIELLSINNVDEINYYINKTISLNIHLMKELYLENIY